MAIAFNQSYQVLNPTQSLNQTPYSLVLPANATEDFKSTLLANRPYFGLGFFLFGENQPSGTFNETQFLTVESTFANETYPQLVYTWNQPINFTVGNICQSCSSTNCPLTTPLKFSTQTSTTTGGIDYKPAIMVIFLGAVVTLEYYLTSLRRRKNPIQELA